jgi:hypothetical protein
VNTVLGIDFHQEVHVFGHDFQFKDLGIMFRTDALDNLFKSRIDPIDEDRAPILGTPDHVIFTGVNHVIIRFVADGV